MMQTASHRHSSPVYFSQIRWDLLDAKRESVGWVRSLYSCVFWFNHFASSPRFLHLFIPSPFCPTPRCCMCKHQLHCHPGKLGTTTGSEPQWSHHTVFHRIPSSGRRRQHQAYGWGHWTWALQLGDQRLGEMDRVQSVGEGPHRCGSWAREYPSLGSHRWGR